MAKQYSWENLSPLDGVTSESASDTHFTNILRLVSSPDDVAPGLPPTRRSSPQDWAKLIDRVRQAASHAREIEAQAQAQELRVQEILDRVREDVKNAAERVRTAEARTVEVQSRTDAIVKNADERVKAAEERARVAEEWLSRIYDTITSEFTIESDLKRGD